MILVVGLGNFPSEYNGTYHNIGFDVMDKLASFYLQSFSKKKCSSKIFETMIGGKKVIFAKPQTYMNLSYEAIREFMIKFKISVENVLVVCDDIDLKLGDVRYRESGSGGTHNGLRGIANFIGTNFKRVKVGVGRDEKFANLADFVLSKIDKDKKQILNNACENAAKLIIEKIEGMCD